MADVTEGTLAEIEANINNKQSNISVLVGYDYDNSTWRVIAVNSEGKIITTT